MNQNLKMLFSSSTKQVLLDCCELDVCLRTACYPWIYTVLYRLNRSRGRLSEKKSRKGIFIFLSHVIHLWIPPVCSTSAWLPMVWRRRGRGQRLQSDFKYSVSCAGGAGGWGGGGRDGGGGGDVQGAAVMVVGKKRWWWWWCSVTNCTWWLS